MSQVRTQVKMFSLIITILSVKLDLTHDTTKYEMRELSFLYKILNCFFSK